jgi:hypothetical protein
MIDAVTLNSLLGMHIRQLCVNGYAADSDNHCAHFVSHVLNLGFGYTCSDAVAAPQRRGAGANVRVHEIFDRCPGVRALDHCPARFEGLIFVSAPGNFTTDAAGRASLRNVPKKHIGLFLDGEVWHYSNGQRQVVRQSLAQFIRHYPNQRNALWVGEIPAGAMPFVCVGP